MKVALAARAKLNLDLQVLGRRADGFHEIRTHMQAVALHDLLEVASATRTGLTVEGLTVPKGGDNIVLRTVSAVEKVAGRELPTEVRLHKRIPPGAGLGGASSDAAAVLRAMQVVHGVELDLMKIAKGLGADVPFFLKGGSALVEGNGDRLTPLPAEPAWYVIAWPGVELSTAAVYKAWDEAPGEAPNQLRRAAEHVDQRVQDFAARLGHAWQMTGSGSAFFRRCSNREEGDQLAKALDCWNAVTNSVGAWD